MERWKSQVKHSYIPCEYGGGIISPTLGLNHFRKRGKIQLTVFLQKIHQRLASSREQLCQQCPEGAWKEKEREKWSGAMHGFSLLGERQEVFGACTDLLSRVVRARVLATKSFIDTEILVGRILEYHFCTILGTAQDVCGGQRQSQQRNIGASRGKLWQMEVLREKGFIQSAFWSYCD